MQLNRLDVSLPPPSPVKAVLIILSLFLVVIAAGVWTEVAKQMRKSENDVRFESSDGLWTDGTVNFKGRDFTAVVWSFESYKLLRHKPDVTLVRVTPDQPGHMSGPEWKVPYAPSSGVAKSIITGAKPEQLVEIKKRTDAALEYWRTR